MSEWVDPETRVERAHSLYEKGQWAAAVEQLRAAIAVNPHQADWHFNLALTLEAMEDYKAASYAYCSALELSPGDVEVMNCMGVNMTRLGRYAEALNYFEQIERLDPAYEQCYCNRIITYTEIGEHEKAELMFYLARQVKEECPLCYFNIGRSLYARSEYDRAIYCWHEALRLAPLQLETNASLAEAYWARGELAKAREHFEAELVLDCGDCDTLVNLGELLMEMNQPAEAVKSFLKALTLDDNQEAAHFGLGVLALDGGRLGAAEQRFRRTLAINRGYARAHGKLGEVLLRRGKAAQAAGQFDEELRLCGDDPSRLRWFGKMLLSLRQGERASSVWRRLAITVGDDASVQHNLAVSYFLMGQLDEGIKHCLKAIKLKPDYSLALYNLALACLKKGQLIRARYYTSRAINVAPGEKNVKQLAQRLGMDESGSTAHVRLTPRHSRRVRSWRDAAE